MVEFNGSLGVLAGSLARCKVLAGCIARCQ